MRTKKLWSRVISILLVIALLPVSALAEFTADPHVVTQPDFTVTVSHVNPEYERLGVKFTKPAADCMTMAQSTVNSLDEAADYLREQMEDRVTEVTIVVNNHTYVDGEGLKADWRTILYGAFEHTGVPTQGDYIIRHYGQSEGGIGHDGISKATFNYTITYDTTLEQENTVGDKIDELFGAWDELYGFYDLSDYEKIEIIYDYICAHVVYDYDTLNDASYTLKYSAYAALINGTAVCQGYANLFYRMALEAGIDNRIIIGDAGGAHAWNIADMGENYYYLDSTWDAPRFDYGYDYFLLGSDNFCLDHTPNAEFLTEEFLAEYPIAATDFDRDAWLTAEATEAGLLTYFESASLSSSLTRLDAAKLIAVLAKLELDPNATLAYEDCAALTDQEKQIIAAVEKFGVMTAYDDGTFRPSTTIDRARFALVLYRAMNGGVDAEDLSDYADDGYFTDVSSILWYAPYVNYLASVGVIPTWGGKTFYPDNTADLRTAVQWVRAALRDNSGDTPEIPEDALASGTHGENLTWYLAADYTLYILGEGAMDDCVLGEQPWAGHAWEIVKVVIGEGVTTVGKNVFGSDYELLSSVELPDTLVSIGEYAFGGCALLTSIDLPDSLTTIGVEAFAGSGLTSIKLGDNVTSIGRGAFGACTDLKSATLPAGLKTIENALFSGCRALVSVEIPASVTSIGFGAFEYCTSLAAVTIPAGVTSIGAYAFSKCETLKSVEIPNGVTTISESMFESCTALASITIPVSVTEIEWYAFSGCTALTTVNYGGTEAKWQEIEIGVENDPLLSAAFVYGNEDGGDEGDEHTHTWGDVTYTWSEDNAKCTAERTCSGCGESEKETVTATAKTTDSTCTEVGYTVYTAVFTTDGFAKQEKTVEIPVKDHTEETVPGKEATCTEPGLTEGKKCAKCGKELVKQEEIPALEHDYDEGVVTKEPTCTEDGVKTYTCEREGCGHSYTETVEAKGHTDENGDYICDDCDEELCTEHTEEVVPGKEATCTEPGLTEGKKCAKCGKELVKQEEIPALGHDYDDGVVTTEPTCTEDGVKTYTCEREGCDHNYTETVEAKGHTDEDNDYICDDCDEELCTEHTEEVVPGKAATCTETGLTEGKKCATCGKVLEEQEEIPALGHDYDDGVVTTEPTLMEAGVKTYTCEREGCGHSYTEEIAVLEFIEGTCGENVTWTLTKDGVLTISGEGAMYNFEFSVDLLPQSFAPMGEETAAQTAPWSEYAALITCVIIKNGVTSIGDNAFADCENLTEIEISKTVTSIGEGVFTGCEALETVIYTGSEEQWAEVEIGEGNEVMDNIQVTIADIILGDVSGNEVVDIFDAIALLTLITDGTAEDLSSREFNTADVNGDGYVDIFDAIALLTLITSGTDGTED